MAYAHRRKWTEREVINEIMGMVDTLKMKSFPTHSQMLDYFGNHALLVKVSKSGGSRHWAEKVGLPIMNCESELGNDFELLCMAKLIDIGFDCQQMNPRYPYDIAANNHIKIDVKSGFRVDNANGIYYTFNIQKFFPTCDMFVLYCLNSDKTIFKTYVIPSLFLQGQSQVSLGIESKKYDKFINRWDYFQKYDDFYKSILGE